jgi:hypothetical protein
VNNDLCFNCHGQGAFDFGTNLATLQGKKTGYFAAIAFIQAQLGTKNIFYNRDKAPYFFTTSNPALQSDATKVVNWYFSAAFQGADLMGAAYNLRLLDSDGKPARFPLQGQGDEPQELSMEGRFEVGRPPGLPAGTEVDQNFAVPIPPGLPLLAGATYEWRLEVDGTHEDDWSARFFVRP